MIKLWGNISRATVQRTLKKLEQLGLFRRLTGPPKKQPDGSWTQQRKLVLLLLGELLLRLFLRLLPGLLLLLGELRLPLAELSEHDY